MEDAAAEREREEREQREIERELRRELYTEQADFEEATGSVPNIVTLATQMPQNSDEESPGVATRAYDPEPYGDDEWDGMACPRDHSWETLKKNSRSLVSWHGPVSDPLVQLPNKPVRIFVNGSRVPSTVCCYTGLAIREYVMVPVFTERYGRQFKGPFTDVNCYLSWLMLRSGEDDKNPRITAEEFYHHRNNLEQWVGHSVGAAGDARELSHQGGRIPNIDTFFRFYQPAKCTAGMKSISDNSSSNSNSNGKEKAAKEKKVATAAQSRFVHAVISKSDDGPLDALQVEPPAESLADLLLQLSTRCGGFQGTVDPKTGAVFVRGWKASCPKGTQKVAAEILGVSPPEETSWDPKVAGNDYQVFVLRKHFAAHKKHKDAEAEKARKEKEKEEKQKEKEKELKLKEKEKEKARKLKEKEKEKAAKEQQPKKRAKKSAASSSAGALSLSRMEIDAGEEGSAMED